MGGSGPYPRSQLGWSMKQAGKHAPYKRFSLVTEGPPSVPPMMLAAKLVDEFRCRGIRSFHSRERSWSPPLSRLGR